MQRLLALLFVLICFNGLGQITGKVIDAETSTPIPYVNVWIKNTSSGSTTNTDGVFVISGGKVGDTLLISNLGYEEKEQIAKSDNNIKLTAKNIELAEVVVRPMRGLSVSRIISYDKPSQVKEFYFNGHYSLARYIPYKAEYGSNRFINSISLVAESTLKSKVKFRVHLLSADENGNPTKTLLSDYYLMECGKGKSQIEVDFQDEKIVFPENGFFVVVDRLNLEENKFSNKLAKDILQPAIGMEKDEQPMNTWMTFGGKWLTPEKMKEIPNWKNIAVNIVLSD